MTKPLHFIHNTDIGQNFLIDRSVVEWMIKRAALESGDRVLEIGPGEGILTRELLGSKCGAVCAIELDTRLKAGIDAIAARNPERFVPLWGDAVQFDYVDGLPWMPTRVIANLPYHITTPLMWAFLEKLVSRGLGYMLLMVQVESAERMVSKERSRDRSPLGITIEAMGRAEIVRKVPPSAFHPQPRVNSCLIEIKLDKNMDIALDKSWRALLARSFAQRRKTLVNNWVAGYGGLTREGALAVLERHGLPQSARAEELPLDVWMALAREPEFAAKGGR